MVWDTVRPSWPPFAVWRVLQAAKRMARQPIPFQPVMWPAYTPSADLLRLRIDYMYGMAVVRPDRILTGITA